MWKNSRREENRNMNPKCDNILGLWWSSVSPSQTGLLRISGCWSHFSAPPPGHWLYCGDNQRHMLGFNGKGIGGEGHVLPVCVVPFEKSVGLPFWELGPLLGSLQLSLQDHQLTSHLGWRTLKRKARVGIQGSASSRAGNTLTSNPLPWTLSSQLRPQNT